MSKSEIQIIEKRDIKKEYEKIEMIGDGQFANVYKGEKNQKYYAIKVISKQVLQEEQQKYLSQEIFVLKSMKNENTVYFVDCAEWKDEVFIVMEYCRHNLKNYMQYNNYATLGMPENEALKAFVQISKGMIYLHTNNFIHRDIKLENILVTDQTIFKIADFGFSKQTIIDRNLAQNGTFVGTLFYMSPEMLKGEAHIYKIDIWSMGIVLIQLLLGIDQFPFVAGGQINIMKNMEDHFQRQENGLLNLEEIFYPEKIKEKNQNMSQEESQLVDDRYKKLQTISKECIDLIQKMMVMDFSKRIDTQEILEHPVFQQFKEVPEFMVCSKLFYNQKLEHEFLFLQSRCIFLQKLASQIKNHQLTEIIFPQHSLCYFLNKTQLFFLNKLKDSCSKYRMRQDLFKIGLEWWQQFEKSSNIYEVLDKNIQNCESELKNNKQNVLKEAQTIQEANSKITEDYLKENMEKQQFVDFKLCFKQINELVISNLRTIINQRQDQYKQQQIEIYKLMLKILTCSCIHSILCDNKFIQNVFCYYFQKLNDDYQENLGSFFDNYDNWINSNQFKTPLFKQYQQIEQTFFQKKQQQKQQI